MTMDLNILVVEDDESLAEALQDTLQMAGYTVCLAENGLMALRLLEHEAVDLIISDINMPKMDGHSLLKKIRLQFPEIPVILMTAYGTIQQAVDAMRNGAADYMVKPFEAEVLVNMVGQYIGSVRADEDMIVVDEASQELARIAMKVADSDATIMISGESGVGKEVLAQFIHRHSARHEQPFVAINCAAIPENMLEATLFGYEKGAFTGAYKACPGKFEQAQGGTLLLDEISEMDLGLQAKLLRVLQEREVERLGSTEMIKLDVRVLATSNRDMQSVVAEGRFREDLFYRLNVFPLTLCPLRERRGDIVPLAKRLLEKHARASGQIIPELSSEACADLLRHRWPGNIRELDNVIQRALILHSDALISEQDLHFEVVTSGFGFTHNTGSRLDSENGLNLSRSASVAAIKSETKDESLNSDLKQREWDLILDAIRSSHGSRKLTAERLGISQRTLRYKLARMRDAGIVVPGSPDSRLADQGGADLGAAGLETA
ncbi:Flagellar two-component response regulator FleR [hydrothermal vent metagenome]|uniref:Flagellar two-component response regulator FleR n=1 Tax=hydrothermal vent metagenome TaxID=652676 RepID=A0A3B1BRY9_9ZZZZ